MEIIPIPAFSDNYIWAICADGQAAVVDPGDAAPVARFLDAEGLTLAAILVTHHHGDHVGGVEDLLGVGQVPVFGPAAEPIPRITHPLRAGDRIAVPGSGLSLEVLEVPGHTRGHIAYVGSGELFCGDTLFACGCGRLFEGTPLQMSDSLDRLAALSTTTRVRCAHEYTLANIRFALAVEPHNPELAAREQRDRAKRERGVPTLPSTIGEELATNPFLRTREPAVCAAAARHAGRAVRGPVQTFAVLREWKNEFRG